MTLFELRLAHPTPATVAATAGGPTLVEMVDQVDARRHAGIAEVLDLLHAGRPGFAYFRLCRSVQEQWTFAGHEVLIDSAVDGMARFARRNLDRMAGGAR